jgi:hypothetical protein
MAAVSEPSVGPIIGVITASPASVASTGRWCYIEDKEKNDVLLFYRSFVFWTPPGRSGLVDF